MNNYISPSSITIAVLMLLCLIGGPQLDRMGLELYECQQDKEALRDSLKVKQATENSLMNQYINNHAMRVKFKLWMEQQ